MKKKISVSLLALVLCVPAVMLLSGSVPLPAQKDASALLPLEQRKAIARGLYGRIELVKHSTAADYLVYVTSRETEADLRVEVVGSGAVRPGQWEIVNSGGDFRVYVTNRATEADIIIYYVNSAPGPTR